MPRVMLGGLAAGLVLIGVGSVHAQQPGAAQTPGVAPAPVPRSPAALPMEEEPLVTDRPDFTEASSTVGRGRIQMEGGWTFTRDTSPETRVNEHVFPELLLRGGVTDEIELRFGWEGYIFSREFDRAVRTHDTIDGATDIDLGVKIELTEQHGWFPETAVIGAMTLPTGAEAFTAHEVQPGANLLYSWEILDSWSVAGSTGIAALHHRTQTFIGGPPPAVPVVIDHGDNFVEVSQSLTTGVGLTDSLGMYGEWFAFFRTDAEDNGPEHYLNGGFTYLLSPDVQLDWRAGFGLNERSADFFTGAGVAVRF